MRRNLDRQRGSALLVVVTLTTILLMMVLALFVFANNSSYGASTQRRLVDRNSCAMAGLQLARAYYGNNVSQWSSYLQNPAVYNPFDPVNAAQPSVVMASHSHNELFADLDGDGLYDVYFYVRDNPDELPPAVPNPYVDNDQAVIVGAMCISQTMAPLQSNGAPQKGGEIEEALLQYNQRGSPYNGTAAGAGGIVKVP